MSIPKELTYGFIEELLNKLQYKKNDNAVFIFNGYAAISNKYTESGDKLLVLKAEYSDDMYACEYYEDSDNYAIMGYEINSIYPVKPTTVEVTKYVPTVYYDSVIINFCKGSMPIIFYLKHKLIDQSNFYRVVSRYKLDRYIDSIGIKSSLYDVPTDGKRVYDNISELYKDILSVICKHISSEINSMKKYEDNLIKYINDGVE